MKQLLVTVTLVVFLGFVKSAPAFQEVFDSVVQQAHMDQGNQLCTITIDRVNHPYTSRTRHCLKGTFSWKCLNDDYRFSWAQQSRDTRRAIQIRYSEYRCADMTNNMLLLTVW